MELEEGDQKRDHSVDMKKNKYLSVILMVCSLTVFIWGGEWWAQNKAKSEKTPIFINEVCSNNYAVLKEGEANYPDYIELYNAGEKPVSLEGYCLSDSKNGMEKSSVGKMIMEPHSYLLIYADDQKAEGHVGFKLNKNGEQLFLISPQGKVVDSVEIPALKYNTSFSRMKEGKDVWERRTATPGKNNNMSERVPDPDMEQVIFSSESGFYKDEFLLTLRSTEGYDIYYTLDGSKVGMGAIKYEMPIRIKEVSGEPNRLAGRKDLSPKDTYSPSYCVNKAVVVRAAAYDRKSGLFSESTSKTYFVGYESKPEYQNFPIISMVTDPEQLFDFEKGIYGNGAEYQNYLDAGGYQNGEILDSFIDKEGNKRELYMASNSFKEGREWEREAQIDYFDSDHNLLFSKSIGIRISGESTRSRFHKSLKLYARDIYDDDRSMIFDWNGEQREWKAIRLRNGGNESDTNIIKNAFIQSLIMDRNVAVQDAAPCILFLDGEYWGFYFLTEIYGRMVPEILWDRRGQYFYD